MSDKAIRFEAVETFHSDELQSTYEKGLRYTYHPDAAHAKLAEMLPIWVAENKVKVVDEVQSGTKPASVTGSGHVG